MKFGLYFGARKTVSLVDLETGEILTHTADYSKVQQYLSAYEDNYTLTILESKCRNFKEKFVQFAQTFFVHFYY